MTKKPIDIIEFKEANPPTIEDIISIAIKSGADKKSIEIFLKVLSDNNCSIIDGWDTYMTD